MFREAYQIHKESLDSYFQESSRKPIYWDFESSLVFAKFDGFVDRINDLAILFKDAQDLLKLEKIEFGGIKGKALSDQVVAMFEEFNKVFKVFGELDYDALDPKDGVRLEMFYMIGNFIEMSLELSQRFQNLSKYD